MKIGTILRVQQSDIYNQLNNCNGKKKERKSKKDHLSFSDIQELMKHDSYIRRKGALKQRTWGK